MSDRSKKPTERGVPRGAGPPPIPDTEEKLTEVDPNPFGRRKSEPIQVVSMKTPDAAPAAAPGPPPQTPIVPRPKLRAISEITPLPHAQPRNLGYLAPPRDPAEVRSRRVRDLVLWSSVAVIVASVVALVIWFVAR
jgi:hypothetical protein